MVSVVTGRAALKRQLASMPLFEGVVARSIDSLLEEGVAHRYRKGTYLFHQGDQADDVHLLVEGRVEISSTSYGGQRVLHTTLDEAQFFGELGVLGEMPRTSTALALTDVQTWVLRAEGFLGFLSREPAAARALLRVLARQVQSHEDFVDDLLFLDLKGRVAKRLLQLVTPSLETLPADGVVVPAVVTHADLASLCGGSRENVTRILSDLQKRGLIRRDGRRFVLLKPKGLAKLAAL